MAASPLTKNRASSERVIDRDRRPLRAGVKTWMNGLASVDAAGNFGPATGAIGEIVVGRFAEVVDNSAGGAGAALADIRYPYERNLLLLDNDAVAPLTVTARERVCSVLDDHTATVFNGSLGNAGVVYDVTTEGVWVDIDVASSVLAASGVGAIQAGTTTLIAGTKTVTPVSITANSRIFLTMRDPGAGALTTFVELDAPVAGRTVGAAGSFIINAIDNAKATLATAVCTVDYLIIG